MSNSNGMSAATKAIFGLVCFVIFVALFAVYSFFSYSNKGVKMENDIKDARKTVLNIISSCTGKIPSLQKIPREYIDGFVKLINADHNGRYGGDTMQRVVKFMQERNLSYNDTFLKTLSNELIACENQVEQKQNVVNSMVSTYSRQLEQPWSGMFYRFHGFPRINLSDYDMILHEGVKEQDKTNVRKRFDAE